MTMVKNEIQEILDEKIPGSLHFRGIDNGFDIEQLKKAVILIAERIDHLYECKCEKPHER